MAAWLHLAQRFIFTLGRPLYTQFNCHHLQQELHIVFIVFLFLVFQLILFGGNRNEVLSEIAQTYSQIVENNTVYFGDIMGHIQACKFQNVYNYVV